MGGEKEKKENKENKLDTTVKDLARYGIKLTYQDNGGGRYSFTLQQTSGSLTIEYPLKARTLDELTTFVKPILSVAEQLKDAKEKYGIDISFYCEANGTFRFTETTPDRTGPLRARTPEELEKYLKPLIEAKKKDAEEARKRQEAKDKERDVLLKKLEEKFDVTFARDGEKSKYRGKETTCRTPTLEELKAFETALYRGQPSHLLKSGKKMRFELVNDTVLDGATAFRAADRIVFQPSMKREGTEHTDVSPYRGPGTRGNSLVATVLHELAHNTQGRLDKDFDLTGSGSAEQAKLGEKLGFRKCVTEKSGETVWLLEARTKSDGEKPDLFRRLPGEQDYWVRCDEKGEILQEKKDEKKPKFVERLSGLEMRQRAKVNLPTSYNDNPTETLAEALTCLRLGGSSLKMLIKECPEVYQMARELDRQDIMKTYGPLKDDEKQPKFVRNENGQLVPNTEAEREKITKFEEKARKG